jgi:cyclopropane fatty-acyl-phospholipid synthase-like methyltransferase
MFDPSEILCCPNCGGEMKWSEMNLFCSCGYGFIWSDNFFSINNSLSKYNNNYTKFYTKEYYQSSLYDYTSFRLNRIMNLAKPKIGSRILDLGCGPGEIAIRCAKLGAEVFGIDVSRDALGLSASRSFDENVHVNLFEFDGRKTPFKSFIFDSIVLADVIEHIDDKTLECLMIECSRLLVPGGRVIMHSSPTKNIIKLSKLIKKLSFNKFDFYSRLVNPEYEFLHIRYHSQASLSRVIKRSSLNTVMWGDFQYLEGSLLSKILDRHFLRDLFGDQLWCLAFKDKKDIKLIFKDMPYMNFIDVPSEINMGTSAESFIIKGFYNSELDSFRWIEKSASIFINIPENSEKIQIDMSASNPDIGMKPINVNLFLEREQVSELSIYDGAAHTYSIMLPKGVKSGITELKIEVDRTFVPKDFGINDDPRELGVAIYNIKIF